MDARSVQVTVEITEGGRDTHEFDRRPGRAALDRMLLAAIECG